MKKELELMERQLAEELPRVLKFWEDNSLDRERGIFLTLGCDNAPLRDGRRSGVLICRVLWAYSAACRLEGGERWREAADIAYEDLRRHYIDRENGGIYELLDSSGAVKSGVKATYTQSYAVYALSEYAMATGNSESLETAWDIFRLIQENAFDRERNGYHTSCSRAWQVQPDCFMLDTHLHLIEAYTNLHKAQPDDEVRGALLALTDIMISRHLTESGRLCQKLSLDWESMGDDTDRFGDEAECCWMLTEAAVQLGGGAAGDRIRSAVELMGGNILTRGLDREHGGVFDCVRTDGSVNTDKLWWEESETVTAMLYLYALTGREEYFRAAQGTWEFMRRHICTPSREWIWKVSAAGRPITPADPADPLKCPYHSSRVSVLCVPLLRRLAGSAE